jgi:hypothetical protein
MREEGFMSTASPLLSKQETIKLTLSGQKITEDLKIIYLPAGVYDFIVDGSDPYLVLFDDPKVFGVSFATLRKGSNLFARQNDHAIKGQVISEAAVLKSLPGDNVETTPIVIPPKPPKRVGTRVTGFPRR